MCILTLYRTVIPGRTLWGLLSSLFQDWPSVTQLFAVLGSSHCFLCRCSLWCNNPKADLYFFPFKNISHTQAFVRNVYHIEGFIGRIKKGFCIEFLLILVCSVKPRLYPLSFQYHKWQPISISEVPWFGHIVILPRSPTVLATASL